MTMKAVSARIRTQMRWTGPDMDQEASASEAAGRWTSEGHSRSAGQLSENHWIARLRRPL